MEKSCLDSEDIRTRLQDLDDPDSIPLADDDVSVVVEETTDNSADAAADQLRHRVAKWHKGHESLDSIPSMISDSLPVSAGPSSLIGITATHVTEQMTRMCLDPDFSPDEAEEKARLITQVRDHILQFWGSSSSSSTY